MGLSSDLTWRHCDGLDPSLITAAQLATNVTNLLLSLRMYRRTMIESVQKVTVLNSM